MIPQETINAILEAARIEEVVGEFVNLKRRGANLIGLCPFHQEKTPSFNVSPARGIFKCFGCGKAGDSVRFVMEHEHYSYVEALHFLAKKYNIQIEEREQSAEELMALNVREKMFNINTFAQEYFSNVLFDTEEGRDVGMSYFKERGFREAIIKKFQLGYSPNQRDAFTKHAVQHGYDKETLLKIGLSTGNDEWQYDRFQGRVIFPVHNLTGKVIGFGGRVLTKEKTHAKYVNSPESEIYNKSHTLYGIYFAKNAISKADNCILVEGYFDVLSMHQAGIENVVASSGTSLTIEQIKLVHRYTQNITMLYDGDAAGLKASLRGTDMVLEEGMNVRVVMLPPEDDPDSFVQKHSTEEVEQYIAEHATDFITFKTKLLLKDAGSDPIKKSEVIRSIIESIAVIPDSIFRASYIKQCSTMLDIDEPVLMNELNKLLRQRFSKALNSETFDNTSTTIVAPRQDIDNEKDTKSFFQEKELVKILLTYGSNEIFVEEDEANITVAAFVIDDLKNDQINFTDPVFKKFFDIFDQQLDQNMVPNDSFFIQNEDTEIAQTAADLLCSPYKLDNWESHKIYVKNEVDFLKEMVQSSLLRYKDGIISNRLSEIEKQLKSETEIENQLILLKQKKNYDELRKKINAELGIVIAK